MSEIKVEQLVDKIEGMNLSLIKFYEGLKRRNKLLNVDKFSQALAKRTENWSSLERRDVTLEFIDYGIKIGIKPFLITYHLPEVLRNRSLFLLRDTSYRRVEEGFEQLTTEQPLSKFHKEYWFHPYQLFDYAKLIDSWKQERSEKSTKKRTRTLFHLAPPIQSIIPLLYGLENYLLPYVVFPEYEQFINKLESVREKIRLLGFEFKEIFEMRRQIIAYSNGCLGFTGDLLKLIEQANHSRVKKNLKSHDLLGFELLEIAEILRLMTDIISNEKQLIRDEVFNGRKGDWKLNVYGKKTTKSDRNVLLDLLSKFGINPTYLMTIYTEGTSDIDFINSFLRETDSVKLTPNISFESLRGTTNKVTKHIIISRLKERLTLETTNPTEDKDYIFVHSKMNCAILFLDPENLFKPSKKDNSIEWIKKQLKSHFTYHYGEEVDVVDLLNHIVKFYIMEEPLEFNFLDDDEIATVLHILFKREAITFDSERITRIRKNVYPSKALETHISNLGLDSTRFKNEFAIIAGRFLAEKIKKIYEEDSDLKRKYPLRQSRLLKFHELLYTTFNNVEKANIILKKSVQKSSV